MWHPRSKSPEQAIPTPRVCWIVLGAIGLLFFGYCEWLHPASMFGAFHDDSLYFSSARALAAGRGYIIPSLPGTPEQTKYPFLYPWMLSRIWKWFPDFPGNVMPAIRLTALFGCWFLVAAFQFLRRISGLGEWAALAIVALVAFQPDFVLFNGAVLSDVPFIALALTAIVLADSALQVASPTWIAALAGGCSGISVNIRTIGVATTVGILCIALGRREYRRGLIILLVAAPLIACAVWPSVSGAYGHPSAGVPGSTDPLWHQTRLFYTSYLADWENSVRTADLFFRMIEINALLLFVAPIRYFLAPALEPRSAGALAVYLPLTLLLFAGIVRQIRTEGWKTVHAVFLAYAAILLIWPYPLMSRFLLLFLPFFCASLYLEGKRLIAALLEKTKSGVRATEKASAVGLAVIVAAVGVFAAWNYAEISRVPLHARIDRRAAILEEKRQAYDWVRRNTEPGTTMVAFEDVVLYLYTDRQAMRPIASLPSCCAANDPAILEFDMNHIMDVPRHIHAGLWLMADDYFETEGRIPRIGAKMAELKSQLPLVFSSREGHVQIYDLSKQLAPSETESSAR